MPNSKKTTSTETANTFGEGALWMALLHLVVAIMIYAALNPLPLYWMGILTVWPIVALTALFAFFVAGAARRILAGDKLAQLYFGGVLAIPAALSGGMFVHLGKPPVDVPDFNSPEIVMTRILVGVTMVAFAFIISKLLLPFCKTPTAVRLAVAAQFVVGVFMVLQASDRIIHG